MIQIIKNKWPITIPIISYLGASWLVIEVASMFISHFNLPQWTFIAVLIELILGFPFILVFIIKKYIFEPLYIDAQINGVKTATQNVYMSIHSLTPAKEKHRKARILNEMLKKARDRGVDVKILAPGGSDRAEGAYIVHEQYGLDIRFAHQLEDEDLRYTIVDNSIVIITYQKIPAPATRLSRKFATIKSERLNSLLKNYFNDIWTNDKTLNFGQYVHELLYILNATGPESLQRCSDRLGIPVHILERFI